MILKDEDVRKRTLPSSHTAANSDAEDQSMNDNSTLDSDAQDRNVNNDNHTDSLQWSDDSDDDSQEHHDSEQQETTRCAKPSGQSCTVLTDNVKEKENPIVSDGKVLQKGARVFSEASHANLKGESSQGGYVIFLHGENNHVAPISWRSCKINRAVRSILAANTLTLPEAAKQGFYIRAILTELVLGCMTRNACQ